MVKKSKTYRGQRAYREACKSPCGCFYCTGHSKADLQHKKEIEADREIINNVFLYSVSNNEVAVCDGCKLPLTPEEIQTGHCFNCGEQEL